MPLIVLGEIPVPVPGTPIRLTDSAQYLANAEGNVKFLTCQAVYFQTWVLNTGMVYLGTLGMVRATGVKVMKVFGIPTTAGADGHAIANQTTAAGVDLSAIYIDADQAGEGPLVTLLVS